jgi:lipopolysaccharide export system protein LptC
MKMEYLIAAVVVVGFVYWLYNRMKKPSNDVVPGGNLPSEHKDTKKR